MIKVTVELEDIEITIKDNDSYTVEDAAELTSRAMTIAFGEDVELVTVTEDNNIYIETNVPRDNIQHEGM